MNNIKKKQTAVEYIEDNFSSSKTLIELKQIIKEAKVIEKNNINELLQITKTLFENLQDVYSHCSDRLNDFESNDFVSEYKELITKFDKI